MFILSRFTLKEGTLSTDFCCGRTSLKSLFVMRPSVDFESALNSATRFPFVTASRFVRSFSARLFSTIFAEETAFLIFPVTLALSATVPEYKL